MHGCYHACFVQKWAIPDLFSSIFSLFKKIQFLQQINVKKFHANTVYGAGIQTHNLQNLSKCKKLKAFNLCPFPKH